MGVFSILKFILTALGLFLIGLGIGGTFLVAQAQTALRAGAADVLSRVFEQSASVHSVYIDPLDRSLVLTDFQIENPEGFKKGPMLEIPSVRVRPRLGFFLQEEPSIERITLVDADVYWRYEIGKGSNVSAFADRLEAKSDNGEKRIVVSEVIARDAEFHFTNGWIPKDLLSLQLVTIRIDEPGGGESVSPVEVTSIFLRSVVKEAVTLKGLLTPGDE